MHALQVQGGRCKKHFLATSSALLRQCEALLSHAPINLPNPERDPSAFVEMILGFNWVDDQEIQGFFIEYVTVLKKLRAELSTVYSPTKEATKRQASKLSHILCWSMAFSKVWE